MGIASVSSGGFIGRSRGFHDFLKCRHLALEELSTIADTDNNSLQHLYVKQDRETLMFSQ